MKSFTSASVTAAPYCTHLSKGLLSVVLEVFRVDIEVVFIDGERLGALSDAGYELLHLQESAARPVAFKAPHWDVGGRDTVCRQEMKRGHYKASGSKSDEYK